MMAEQKGQKRLRLRNSWT